MPSVSKPGLRSGRARKRLLCVGYAGWFLFGAEATTGPNRTVLDDFMFRKPSPRELAATDVADFDDEQDRATLIYRVEVDVTGDRRPELFLALGPTGKEGTTWSIYSPDPKRRYHYLGELFFHPASFCYLARQRVFRVGRRCGDRDPSTGETPWATADFAIGATGMWETRTSQCGCGASAELASLLACAKQHGGTAAAPFDAKRGNSKWRSMETWTPAERQPQPLDWLLMAGSQQGR